MKSYIPKYIYALLVANRKQFIFTSRKSLRNKIKQLKSYKPDIKLSVKRSKIDSPVELTPADW